MDEAARLIADADAVLLLTGAGMSVDSGLSSYRGTARKANLWTNEDGEDLFEKHGTAYHSMASPEAFEDTPNLAWGFHLKMAQAYKEHEPHDGYMAALRMLKGKEYFVVTSNVDSYHFRAGFDPNSVLEIHGSCFKWQCANHGKDVCLALWDAPDDRFKLDPVTGELVGNVPTCIQCDSMARPNVCLFHDNLWVPTVVKEQRARLDAWLESVAQRGQSLVLIEIGAGTAINTIRHWGKDWAQRFCAPLIRINVDDCAVSQEEYPSGGVGLPAGAKEALEQLAMRVKKNCK